MSKKQYFAVTGRLHGDDEDTGMTFEAEDRDGAVKEFKEEMCALRNLEPEERDEVMSDDPSEHMQVYITSVFRSTSPIEEV